MDAAVTGDAPAWSAEVYAVLQRAGVRQVCYVPDAGHAGLIRMAHADAAMRATVLTTEEEGWRWSPAPGWAGSAAFC